MSCQACKGNCKHKLKDYLKERVSLKTMTRYIQAVKHTTF